MGAREFRDGAQDGLEALEPLDPEKISSFDELLVAMRKTAFGGRRVGEAYEVLSAMIDNGLDAPRGRGAVNRHRHRCRSRPRPSSTGGLTRQKRVACEFASWFSLSSADFNLPCRCYR